MLFLSYFRADVFTVLLAFEKYFCSYRLNLKSCFFGVIVVYVAQASRAGESHGTRPICLRGLQQEASDQNRADPPHDDT
jgi:hypothetical protein